MRHNFSENSQFFNKMKNNIEIYKWRLPTFRDSNILLVAYKNCCTFKNGEDLKNLDGKKFLRETEFFHTDFKHSSTQFYHLLVFFKNSNEFLKLDCVKIDEEIS